ncbi:MAG: response regulator [Chloroflexi bacterium]|nr:response regulator [Chloroflexota bacterium]
MRILIAEDNENIRLALETSIKKVEPDYQVVSVTDGIAALAALYRQPFDLMLTDYNMPGMTGIELAQKVRPILPDMRIVLMSAQDIIEMRTEARHRNLDLDGYLQKPFTSTQVREVVKHLETQKLS